MRSLLSTPVALLVLACGAGASPPSQPSASVSALFDASAPAAVPGAAPEDDEDVVPRGRRIVLEENRRHQPYGEPLPSGAVARLGTKKLNSGFTVVVAAADDTFVSTASYYVGLQKWDLKTGELLATKPLTKEAYANVAATTKDRKLAAFADYKQVMLVDTVSLETKRVIDVFDESDRGRIEDVAFLDDGKLVVAACSKQSSEALRVFDQRGTLLRTYAVPEPTDGYSEACAGPIEVSKGRMIVGMNKVAQLIGIESGDVQGTFESGVAVGAVAFSPDGSRVLVGGYADAVNAFDIKTGKAVRSYGFFSYSNDREVRGLAFSPDGASVAVSASSGVRIYESATGLERLRLGSVGGAVNFQHSTATLGNVLAFPLADPDLIGRFDWTTGAQLTPHDLGRHDEELTHGAISDDGVAITSSRDGTIRRWDAATGAPIATFTHEHAEAPIALAKDGTVLSLSASKRHAQGYAMPICAIRFHEPATLAVREEVMLHESTDPDACFASGLVLSTDGSIAHAHFGERLVTFDLDAKKVLSSIVAAAGHRGSIVALSNGTIATLEGANWSVRDGRSLTKTGELELPLEHLAVSPKSLVGAGPSSESSNRLVIVELTKGKELARVESPKDTTFSQAVAFSPDGSLLYAGFSGSNRSGVLGIAVKSGKVLTVLDKLHEQANPSPRFLAVSPDGKRLLEGNQDQTGLVLDTAKLGGAN